MKISFPIISTFCLAATCQSAELNKPTAQLNAPWRNPEFAIVIDLYSGNEIDWDKIATDKRVTAIIHKATEGLKTDGMYTERKNEAIKRGYLWGSYHLGRPGDPVEQAKHYLDIAKPGPDELIALDLEEVGPKYMTLDAAKIFVTQIESATQRRPIIYLNHASTNLIGKDINKETFAKLPLWYARFKEKVDDFPNKIWPEYTLWQFSSEINCFCQNTCQYNVYGTRYDVDVNIFFGSRKLLRKQWPLTPKILN